MRGLNSSSHFEVAQASSPARSKGVPPRFCSKRKTPSELAAGPDLLQAQHEHCCGSKISFQVYRSVQRCTEVYRAPSSPFRRPSTFRYRCPASSPFDVGGGMFAVRFSWRTSPVEFGTLPLGFRAECPTYSQSSSCSLLVHPVSACSHLGLVKSGQLSILAAIGPNAIFEKRANSGQFWTGFLVLLASTSRLLACAKMLLLSCFRGFRGFH
jgi:hypothetical protein